MSRVVVLTQSNLCKLVVSLHVFTRISFIFRTPGNRWALEQAKFHLVNKYLLVGITEELGDFIAVLEATLPRFFHGAVELYNFGEL